MEATRLHIAAKVTTEKHTRTVFRDACAWFLATYPKTELPYTVIYDMVIEEQAKVAKPETPSTEWPVMLTKEEAVAVAKKVGADEKAEDIKTAIVDKATAVAMVEK